MTDQEKHQALERYLSWKDHPYTNMVFEYFNKNLSAAHVSAENSINKDLQIEFITEARILRGILQSLKSPLVVNINSKAE